MEEASADVYEAMEEAGRAFWRRNDRMGFLCRPFRQLLPLRYSSFGDEIGTP